MNEDTDEFLTWLCWMWAMDGERFYPPDETAWECVEAVWDNYADRYDNDRLLALKLTKAYEWELGQHSRALDEARIRFQDAEDWGFDPVERAAREHRDLMEQADSDIDPLDWSWYNGQ